MSDVPKSKGALINFLRKYLLGSSPVVVTKSLTANGAGTDEVGLSIGDGAPSLRITQESDKFRFQVAGTGYGSRPMQIGRDDGANAITIPGDLTVTGDDNSIAQEAWTNVSAYGAGKTWDFAQHWENYNASTYQVVGFMKDSMGFVHLRGLAASTDAARGTTIFTLPSGYRPTLTSGFGQRANQTVMGSIYVLASGAVTIATGETALNGFIWLDGIIFDTR